MYIVFEIQTNADGTLGTLTSTAGHPQGVKND